MPEIPFTKAHGTGNDFIFFIKEECPDNIYSPDFIISICERRTGIGADGVIILSQIGTVDFKLDYYNSDGSWETFCANGSRCAVKLLNSKNIISKNSTFEAGDGLHEAEIDNTGMVWIKFKAPKYKSELLKICGFQGRYVDSGAKHFACPSEKLDNEIVESFGPKIRYNKAFIPEGINVNFFKIESPQKLNVITYEKGIEKVMLSCGSGAVAAGYHAAQTNKMESPLSIKTPGGLLNLKFDEDWNDVWLGGPAVLLFESTIISENLVLS